MHGYLIIYRPIYIQFCSLFVKFSVKQPHVGLRFHLKAAVNVCREFLQLIIEQINDDDNYNYGDNDDDEILYNT